MWLGLHSLLLDQSYAFIVQAATSLNSTECFLLQSGSTVFTWHGNQSSAEQQQLAAKVAEFLRVTYMFFPPIFPFCFVGFLIFFLVVYSTFF